MNASTKSKSIGRLGSAALLALLAGGFAIPSLAADCSSATIAEPFALPDGRVFGAGTLSLCLERAHSPVAALYEARVDGLPIGMYFSHQAAAPGEGSSFDTSYLVFDRAANGTLQLLGFVHGDRDGMTLSAFVDPRVRIRVELGNSFAHAVRPQDDAVWVAARRG